MIGAFVPRRLLDRVAAGAAARDEEGEPARLATLLADLSGFSALAEDLAALGPGGAERVTETLNACFAPMLDAIAVRGGDVVTFAGDAVLATWPADADLGPAVARATAAALDAVARVDALPAVEGHRLRLRVGIGAGDATWMDVGGERDRWHHLAVGPAVQQLVAAGRDARPGEVVLSPEAVRAIGARARLEGARAREVDAPLPGPPPVPPAIPDDRLADVRAYVPEPVLGAFAAGETRWLAEIRPVTSLFVSLRNVDLGDVRTRRAASEGFRAVQAVLARFGGGVHKVTMDEKGVLVVAVFGLPPHSHEENAARGVRAALELQAALRALELEHGIGITTGRALCGVLGSPMRRDYTVIAPVVNLAARLMQATASNDVLVDEATVRASRGWVRFADLPPVVVKGSPTPVPVFRPLWGERHEVRQRTVARLRDQLRVVGREGEQRLLVGRLGAVAAGGNGVVLLLGEAGIGKSTLTADLVAAAQQLGVRTLLGAGDTVERNTPWHGWTDILDALLGLDEVRGRDARRRRAAEALAEADIPLEQLPLLNGVLRLDVPENDATRGQHGTVRHGRVVDLVVALLRHHAAEGPLLVALDDGHWLDSASWELALAVFRQVSPVLLCISSRPLEEPVPRELRELREHPSATVLELGTLAPAAIVELVARRLGVRALPDEIAQIVVRRAEGNPFFAEELAYALRDAGRLRIAAGVATVDPGAEVHVPETLQGLVTARLDRLPADEQPTVKVAAVIGRSFGVDLLQEVHPGAPPAGRLDAHLADLARLQVAMPDAPGSWSFKHAITRDAAYALLPFQQRREVHLSVARWYEARLGTLADTALPLLAWHYRAGADPVQALHWIERAGESALDQGAHREAAHFFGEARTLHAEAAAVLGAQVDDVRRARWAAGLGEARLGLGDLEGARDAFATALATVGDVLPQRRGGAVARLVSELMRQAWHLAFGARKDEDPRARFSARVASLLGEVGYFRTDLLEWALASFFAINRAERAGDPAVAARAYGSLANLVGTAGLERLMHRYLARARLSVDPSARMAADWAEAVWLLTRGRFDESMVVARRGIDLGHASGAYYEQGIGITVLGYAQMLSGPVPEALETLRWGVKSARGRGNPQHEGWCLSLQVPLLLALNRVEEALETAMEAEAALPRADPLSVPIAHGVRAQVLARMGRPADALEAAGRAVAAFRDRPPAVYIYLPGLEGVLAALTDPAVREDPRAAGLAGEALGALRGFARIFGIGRPALARWEGVVKGTGHRAWRRGVPEAARWGVGAGHLHLLLATDPSTRATHLDAAEADFRRREDHAGQGAVAALRAR